MIHYHIFILNKKINQIKLKNNLQMMNSWNTQHILRSLLIKIRETVIYMKKEFNKRNKVKFCMIKDFLDLQKMIIFTQKLRIKLMKYKNSWNLNYFLKFLQINQLSIN